MALSNYGCEKVLTHTLASRKWLGLCSVLTTERLVTSWYTAVCCIVMAALFELNHFMHINMSKHKQNIHYNEYYYKYDV